MINLRPVKDLISEEYWCIGYRTFSEDDSVVNADGKKKFKILKASERYWYADPFLFEKDGRLYLFTEMFDNRTEVGMIACSEYKNGCFTEPEPVLKEPFHLSFPYVFEKDGEIFMMPETHEDNCIQLYRAVRFPDKWEKYRVLVGNVNAVDTVIEKDLLIASVVCPENDMTVDISVFDFEGNEMPYSPVYTRRLDKRGAGRIFCHGEMRIRPAQNCENRVYGAKLIFNKIVTCSRETYCEEKYSEISPELIATEDGSVPSGIHTYARSGGIEVVDVKFTRFNVKRLFWILKRKIG